MSCTLDIRVGDIQVAQSREHQNAVVLRKRKRRGDGLQGQSLEGWTTAEMFQRVLVEYIGINRLDILQSTNEDRDT
jgi:hypothetical protein